MAYARLLQPVARERRLWTEHAFSGSICRDYSPQVGLWTVARAFEQSMQQ